MITISHIAPTLLGPIWIATNDFGLVAVSLWDDADRLIETITWLTGATPPIQHGQHPVLQQTTIQLNSYMQGELRQFDLPIDWSLMKPFQRAVLERVYTVGYGRTSTYKAIANELGKPGAARAIGRANATNPIPIIIPCHRILGSDGKLHGYGARGGLETKAWLLQLEGSWLV